MKELVEIINALCANFVAVAQKHVDGNKAAGKSARKVSVEASKSFFFLADCLFFQ